MYTVGVQRAGEPFPIERAADGLWDPNRMFSSYPTPRQALDALRHGGLWVIAGLIYGWLPCVWVSDVYRATWYWVIRDSAVIGLRRRLHR